MNSDSHSPVLIVPYMWIGDFVRCHSVVRVLQQLWPKRPVDMLTTSLCAPLLDYMPGVRLRVFQDGRNAFVDVLDRGPGIPEGVVAQLFRPFFTTSEHGTGLGLYIARELTRANQATLDYVPVPGGGACFRVSLPGPNTILSL